MLNSTEMSEKVTGIMACAGLRSFGLCSALHNQVIHIGLQENFYVVNKLLELYPRDGRMLDAYNLFVEIPVRNRI